jgi:hypothetical protein
MAKRKKQGTPSFNPVSFNVENIQRAMADEVQQSERDDDQPESRPSAEMPAEASGRSGGAVAVPAASVEPTAPAPAPETRPVEQPVVQPAAQPAEPTPKAEAPRPAPAPASTPALTPAARALKPKPAARRQPTTRTPRRTEKPARRGAKGKSLAEAAVARRERDLYKQDYLRVFVDAQQRRDLGRFVMDLNDALDVRLPETIVYRALLSIMQSAQGQILAAAAAGEPLPATPARQDRVQMAEAEYRVAQLLREGILAATEDDLDALYHGKLEADDYDEAYDDAEPAAA